MVCSFFNKSMCKYWIKGMSLYCSDINQKRLVYGISAYDLVTIETLLYCDNPFFYRDWQIPICSAFTTELLSLCSVFKLKLMISV